MVVEGGRFGSKSPFGQGRPSVLGGAGCVLFIAEAQPGGEQGTLFMEGGSHVLSWFWHMLSMEHMRAEGRGCLREGGKLTCYADPQPPYRVLCSLTIRRRQTISWPRVEAQPESTEGVGWME